MATPGSKTSQLQTIRWIYLLQGVVAAIIGLSILLVPTQTLFIFVLVFGGYWFVRGIATLLFLFVDRTKWGWKLFVGAFGVIAGVLAILSPMAVGTAFFLFIVYFIGFQAILAGATELYYGVQQRSLAVTILGLLSFLLGVVLVLHPLMSLVMLSIYLGVVTLAGGVFTIVASLRPSEKRRQAVA